MQLDGDNTTVSVEVIKAFSIPSFAQCSRTPPFQVVLGRRLLGVFMTVYMPTILMNIVGHSTMYFKPFFFEAQVFRQLIFAFISLFLFLCLLSQGLCQSNRNACADNNVCEVSLMTINIKMNVLCLLLL